MTGRRRFPFYTQILVAMVLGIALGRAFGPAMGPFGEFGKVIIQLIKVLALPLLFLAVVDAFLRTEIRARAARKMVAISLFNACLALLIGLTLSNLIHPGDYLRGMGYSDALHSAKPFATPDKIDFVKTFASYLPTSIVQPFADNAVISVILLALLGGMALRRVKNQDLKAGLQGYRHIEESVTTLYRANEVVLAWVVKLVPVAVFGVVARTVGEHGLAPFRGLGMYVGVALLGLLLQVTVVYQAWIVLASGMTLRRFWAGARDAVFYALGASSSLATLPVTLKCLEEMKVSPESARLAACVGTNLNNDGILLYEAMAVLFVAQVHGIQLTFAQQALAAASCMVAGMGIAGVPEAGLISLSLVLTTVGLPIEILPLLLTVDWVLSRARAMTNVVSDILVSVLIDR